MTYNYILRTTSYKNKKNKKFAAKKYKILLKKIHDYGVLNLAQKLK